MKILNPQRYQTLVTEAQSAAFTGWDFSWLLGRMIQEDPPWDYPALVQAQIATARTLLDMGTGGGEFLASLPTLPPETHATESYPPNQTIAQARLRPLGVHVHAVEEDASLPFDDHFFDLVINRHESYAPGEVFRILKPSGIFITQQVGELDNLELNQMLQTNMPYHFTDWGLESEVFSLLEQGFSIIQAEKTALTTRFKDIGAVVYYLKAIPWQLEGFSIETLAEKLVHLHNFIVLQGEFISTAHRFLIIARKEVTQP